MSCRSCAIRWPHVASSCCGPCRPRGAGRACSVRSVSDTQAISCALSTWCWSKASPKDVLIVSHPETTMCSRSGTCNRFPSVPPLASGDSQTMPSFGRRPRDMRSNPAARVEPIAPLYPAIRIPSFWSIFSPDEQRGGYCLSGERQRTVDPGAPCLARLHRRLDEPNTARTLLQRRKVERRVGDGARPARCDRFGHIRVEGGERFVEAFGMSDADPRAPFTGRQEARAGSFQDVHRPAVGRAAQMIGMLLVPLKPALVAVHPDHEAMRGAGSGLGDPHDAARTIFVS